MKAIGIIATLFSTISIIALPVAGATEQTLSRAALLDKVRGGWAGQLIGVASDMPMPPPVALSTRAFSRRGPAIRNTTSTPMTSTSRSSQISSALCPGLPRESNKYCEHVGRVMNYGAVTYR